MVFTARARSLPSLMYSIDEDGGRLKSAVGGTSAPRDSPNGCYGIFGQDRADHSALMLADRNTLAHFSTSSAMNFLNSAGELAKGV